MPGVLGVIARRAAPVLRGHVVAQRASIYTRPAKDKIGSFVSLIYRRTTFDMSRLNVLAAMVCPWLTRSLSVQRSELNVFFVLTVSGFFFKYNKLIWVSITLETPGCNVPALHGGLWRRALTCCRPVVRLNLCNLARISWEARPVLRCRFCQFKQVCRRSETIISYRGRSYNLPLYKLETRFLFKKLWSKLSSFLNLSAHSNLRRGFFYVRRRKLYQLLASVYPK